MLHNLREYSPPEWCLDRGFKAIPTHRVKLAQLPTPIHRFRLPRPDGKDASGSLDGIDIFIKRDDMTGSDASGNKVRKLEFLMADCLRGQGLGKGPCDSVVTVGGVQSNHARATAVVARQLGLTPHLLLRGEPTSTAFDARSPESMRGNLLLDRLVGAEIHPISTTDYQKAPGGSDGLIKELAQKLVEERQLNPYVIPMGGSNAVGLWGYIEAMRELVEQQRALGRRFDHVVVACGSGGTAAGLAIGARLLATRSHPVPAIHGVCVCDSPKWFYNHVRTVAHASGLNCTSAASGGLGDPTTWLKLYDGKGLGYAQNTAEELRYLRRVAESTGVVLDPVYDKYTLKAALFLCQNAASSMGIRKGEAVLFLHTGGIYGTFAKASTLASL